MKRKGCPLGNDIEFGCGNCCFHSVGSYNNLQSCYLASCSFSQKKVEQLRHGDYSPIAYHLVLCLKENNTRRSEMLYATKKIRSLIMGLSSEMKRKVITMRFIKEMSLGEIAKELDVTKQRVSRIIQFSINEMKSKCIKTAKKCNRLIDNRRCADCVHGRAYHNYTYTDGTELTVWCEVNNQREYALHGVCENYKKEAK